jgi:glutamyl-tRNA synthetase
VPLILGADKKRLSKRHGATSVMEYARQGYVPEAMFNFLALLGWSPGDDREVFSTAELLEAFTLGGIGRSNAILTFSETDPRQWTDRKALFINQQYIARMPLADLLPKVEDVLKRHGLWDEAFAQGGARREWFSAAVDLIRARFITLADFADAGRPYFDETFDMDPDAADKNLKKEPRLAEWLPELGRRFAALEPFDHAAAEATLRAYADELGVKAGVLINGTRTAVTGRSMGPSLFELLVVLGRERVARRLADVKI